jgi:hypothetical protein
VVVVGAAVVVDVVVVTTADVGVTVDVGSSAATSAPFPGPQATKTRALQASNADLLVIIGMIPLYDGVSAVHR